MTSPRIAFLFPISKEALIARVKSGQDADTALYGFNHIEGAEHVAVPLGVWAALCSLPRMLQYDVVVAQDHFLLGYLVSLWPGETRWIYLSLTSSTLMRRHAAHPLRLLLLKKFWSSYARIICISREQIEDLVRLGVPRSRLVFIPFGGDAPFFEKGEHGREEALIVSGGRDEGRDYVTLFRAVERMDHSFAIFTSPKNLPQDVPVPQNVSISYDCSFTELRELYARARLVVVVSKGTSIPEGSDCSGQTVILDAMAAGKAVVATTRPWITDYFVPGEDLVLVPAADPGALVRAINELWSDVPMRERLAAAAHEKVVTRYTSATFARGILQLIQTL